MRTSDRRNQREGYMRNDTPIVLVIDDEPSVCVATGRLLRSAGYQVRIFETTQQLFAHGRPPGPCCLVLDLQMPGENGLQFQQRLVERDIRVPIIFVSGRADIAASVSAMKAGANDFLLKPYDDSQLITAIAAALGKDSRSLSVDRHSNEIREHYHLLTSREREVFAAVAAGLLNKQIAIEMEIEEKTIKVHRGRVMEKMHAVALADLVRMADLLRLHWDSPDNTAVYSGFAENRATV
jgi:FixJ family two-component response regulator